MYLFSELEGLCVLTVSLMTLFLFKQVYNVRSEIKNYYTRIVDEVRKDAAAANLKVQVRLEVKDDNFDFIGTLLRTQKLRAQRLRALRADKTRE